MDPGQTVVTERVLYVTFDLTKILKPGPNAIGGLLGNCQPASALPRPRGALFCDDGCGVQISTAIWISGATRRRRAKPSAMRAALANLSG